LAIIIAGSGAASASTASTLPADLQSSLHAFLRTQRRGGGSQEH